MSSSSVCQGLQSCLEPPLVEPRGSRLILAPPESDFSRLTPPTPSLDSLKKEKKSHTEENNTNTTITATTNSKTISDDCDIRSPKVVDMGGWSFLQFINNNFHNTKQTTHENDKVYVHPLVKRSSSALSPKSLEICTESLGSETGSQVGESCDDISFIASETDICTKQEPPKLCETFVTKITKRRFSFPPPLPSISGSTGVQMRPHREGGRLVLQAVTFSSSQSYFHAERSEGRLRLRLVKDCSPNTDDEDDQEEEEEDEAEDHVKEAFDEEEQLVYDAEIGEGKGEGEDEDEADLSEDIEESNEKVKDQIGLEKLPRPSRCKEGGRGNKGLINWEQFWVAT